MGSDIYEIGHIHKKNPIYLSKKFTSLMIIDIFVFISFYKYIIPWIKYCYMYYIYDIYKFFHAYNNINFFLSS